MNNVLLIDKQDSHLVLKISILLLILFILLTIIFFNMYKGNKIILPNLDDEIRMKSKFHLFKSMGWALLITLLYILLGLSSNRSVKYAVNKAVKI